MHLRRLVQLPLTGILLAAATSFAQPSSITDPTARSAGRQQEAATAISELTEDEQQAMTSINERTVKGTVSFLASDELGGRGTPSPGFTVACGYVASRFRAAGLEGGGPDGSFYQSHLLETVRMPSEAVRLEFKNGSPFPGFGLVAATEQTVDYSGPVTTISDWDSWSKLPEDQQQATGEAVMIMAESETPAARQLRQWQRRADQLRKSGVKVLLLAVDGTSDLASLATRMSQSPVWSRRDSESPIPVILVDRTIPITGPVHIRVPPVIRTAEPISNVVGILRGSDSELARDAIIFSAHLDHLGVRDNNTNDRIYNGADDDASGVTGVLSLADAFGAMQHRPARTLIFVAFWGEEMGLLGSKDLAGNPVWPLDRTLAMINIEMIGRPEAGAHGKAWMTGWEHSTLGSTMAKGAARVGVEIFEHPKYSAMLYGASDNWPFAQAGVIAHSFSAGSLHENYHQPDDEWEKLETRHMTLVIRGLFAGALPIANGTLTPQKSGADR